MDSASFPGIGSRAIDSEAYTALIGHLLPRPTISRFIPLHHAHILLARSDPTLFKEVPMSAEENKAVIRRFFEEIINQHDAAAIDQLMAADLKSTFPSPIPGREGFKQGIRGFLRAFPDVRVSAEDFLADGDQVATRGHWTAMHQGEFLGVPPTGRQVQVAYIDIWRVQNGLIVENWVQMDFLSLMQQLGAIPAPE